MTLYLDKVMQGRELLDTGQWNWSKVKDFFIINIIHSFSLVVIVEVILIFLFFSVEQNDNKAEIQSANKTSFYCWLARVDPIYFSASNNISKNTNKQISKPTNTNTYTTFIVGLPERMPYISPRRIIYPDKTGKSI